ncbi:MAG: hypothetical protein EOO06_19355 [Chitinophagaceae bacterium]|nr:MAG: hypothetical protein EOO06_19355 [Chitinophagaceae bacterium]
MFQPIIFIEQRQVNEATEPKFPAFTRLFTIARLSRIKNIGYGTRILGTLSIYDHRDPIFVTSLILFDRIVIPIPPASLDTLTSEEVDQLSADASYLQANGAAITYTFEENEFRSWQRDVIREALAVKTSDSLYDTRLMLKTKSEELKPKDVHDVTAVPVYGAREKFSSAYQSINHVSEKNLLLELNVLCY